ncbi:MAG TPA: heparan-alpha-glucosaminide N-acetyltransferase [Casimicrobiaceae bacterium]|nr:heparan-alpha-glucosaminide N-acetyltransferase [Casimicrobiaceae bacterium]
MTRAATARRRAKRVTPAGKASHAARATEPNAHARVVDTAARPPAHRLVSLDTLRGVAIVAMIAYHLCFDLRYFGITRSDFEHDTRWLTARAAILSSFLLIAGISAVLAARQPMPVRHWLRHVGVIAMAALLVSAGSALVFPQSFIWFGVLHAIAVSLVVAKPLVRRPFVAAIAGVVVIVAGVVYANPAFDRRVLGWLGFMTAKPVTEDYVPLFPWTGVLFLGVALGHLLTRTEFCAIAPLARLPRWLAFLGRHSLAVYLLHQPLLFALLWLATRA